MAIKVDVPLDLSFLEYTKTFFDKETPRFIFFDPSQRAADKHFEQYENLKRIIKDKTVGEHLGSLYRALCIFEGEPDYKNKAIKEFQKHLKKETGKDYKIRLVLSGNV